MPSDLAAEIRMLEPRDRRGAEALLANLQVGVGGVTSAAVRHTFVTDPAFVVSVAVLGDDVVGIALIEITRRWIYRNWFVALQVLAHRLTDLLDRPSSPREGGLNAQHLQSPPAPMLETGAPPVAWNQDLPRTIFIGVAKEFRGRGVADQLYQSVFAHLALRGIPRLIARIARDNTASLKLHKRTGWRLYSEGDTILADKDLSRQPHN